MLESVAHFRRRLIGWYRSSRRDLPWRVSPDAPEDSAPNAYYVLLSEAMLQQTQVSAVVPYFHRFVTALPTLGDLAVAEEQQVLRLWQGLGYYSRARNLHATAKIIAAQMGGEVPQEVETLRTLPGIGPYTAGAISSLAFGRRAPIVDGNVIRVLCRIDRIETDPRAPAVNKRLWERAEEILPRKSVGDFNSALMELGATICTPKSPKCLVCPVRKHCEAAAGGVADRIPVAAKLKARPMVERWTVCVRHGDQWLIEQRPVKGRWAGLWQFFTIEPPDGMDAKAMGGLVRSALGIDVKNVELLGSIEHDLTHRRYRFDAFACEAKKMATGEDGRRRVWVELSGLDVYPLPRPHLKIAEMLARFARIRHVS